MKVIGTTPDGVILQATRNEACNLAGHYSEYDEKARKAIEVGSTIDTTAVYMHRRGMDESQKEREQLAAKLRAAADLIDATMPKPQPAKEEEQ